MIKLQCLRFSTFQRAIDSFEILRKNFTKFDEIKELTYRYFLEDDYKNEIWKN